MENKWRTLRVFISSTFCDMHAERDYLVRFVFPELKEKCRKNRINLIDVDLRWGVTEEDAQDGKALDICLDEIDSCRPYFLGLLGHRYGWIPQQEKYSITAQEIYHGVLHNDIPRQIINLGSIIEGRLEGKAPSQQQIDCLIHCYQWNADKDKHLLRTDASPEDLKIIRTVFQQYSTYQRDRSFFFFRSKSLTKELAGKNHEVFFEIDETNKNRLLVLKQEIIEDNLSYFEYDDIEVFGNKVGDVLWKQIETEIGEQVEEKKGWLEEEAELHELFIADRTRRFVGRRGLLDQMHVFCESDSETSLMVITGDPGSGKSALMARFAEEALHNHPDWLVITHFVGASPISTNLRQVLKRFCTQLNLLVGAPVEVPEDTKELIQIFPELLANAAEQCNILIILDSVNQLEKTDNAHDMRWLPQEYSGNVRFVLSALKGNAFDALQSCRIKLSVKEVTGLNKIEINELVTDYLKEIRHEFPNKQVEQTFFEKVKAGSPLYIQVALEELRIFGKFEGIANRVNSLPDNIPALFDQVLERVEIDFDRALVRDCMSFIFCGKHGMMAEELQILLRSHASRVSQKIESEKLPDMLWARLFRAFKSYLLERSGVIDFFHGQLKEAVGKRYLYEKASRIRSHKSIANYFEARWREPYNRALEELPYHQIQGLERSEALSTLVLPEFLELKCQLYPSLRSFGLIKENIYGGIYDVIQDYEALLLFVGSEGRELTKSERKIAAYIQTVLRRQAHIISKTPFILCQQLFNGLNTFEAGQLLNSILSSFKSNLSEKYWFRESASAPAHKERFTLQFSLVNPLIQTRLVSAHNALLTLSCDCWSLWDMDSGREVVQSTHLFHRARPVALILSNNSEQIAVLLDDGYCCLWFLRTGVEIARWRVGCPPHTLLSGGDMAFSPTGEYLATLLFDGNSVLIRIWKTSNQEKVTEQDIGIIFQIVKRMKSFSVMDLAGLVRTLRVSFTQSGDHLIIATARTLEVWDWRRKKTIWSKEYPFQWAGMQARDNLGEIECLAISAEKEIGAISFANSGLWLWHLSNKPMENGRWLSGALSSKLCFSRDGELLAGIDRGRNGKFRVWRVSDGMEISEMDSIDPFEQDMDISSNPCMLLLGARNRCVAYDLDSEIYENKRNISARMNVIDAAFNKDGTRVFYTLKRGVTEVDVFTGEILWERQLGLSWSRVITYSIPGDVIVIGGDDGECSVWCPGSRMPLEVHSPDHSEITCITSFPSSTAVVIGTAKGNCIIWNWVTGKFAMALPALTAAVTALAISPDEEKLAVAIEEEGEYGCFVWNLKQKETDAIFRGHSAWIKHVTFSPAGDMLVTGSIDTTVRLWSLQNSDGDGVLLVHGAPEPLNTGPMVLFHAKRPWLAIVDEHGCCSIWSVPKGDLLATYPSDLRVIDIGLYGSNLFIVNDKGKLIILEINEPINH